MVAVFVTSLLRARMRPGTWRAVHWLAYLCWPVALAHTFGMGTDAGERWVIVLGVVCVVAVVTALAWRWLPASRQGAAGPRMPVAGVPPKHLVLERAQPDRSPSWLAPADRPHTGRYRILGHPADLAGHVRRPRPASDARISGRDWREAFVGVLEASGLTGRGGAGFPAAIKLAVARAAGPAAPSSSTPWKASPPATRTSFS